MNYIENDNELIYMINDNNDEYRYILFNKYKPIIYSIANDYYIKFKYLNLDFDDLIQEGMIGFNNAINTYKNKDSIFYTYSSICIKRNIISYIRSYTAKKNSILNNALDDSFYNNCIVFDDNIFLSEMYEYEFVFLKNIFRYNDYNVFELKYNGFSNREISLLLDLSMSKVNKTIYKIKNILRKTN